MKYKHLLTLHGLPKQISKQLGNNIDIVFVNRRRKIERSTTQMKMRRSLNRGKPFITYPNDIRFDRNI